MKPPPLRLCGLLLLFAHLPCAWSQASAGKISKIEIKHVGPAAVSDELIRANIRVKVGDDYLRTKLDDDVRNLYATGLFYNIRVAPPEVTPDGVILTYVVQGKPRLTEINFHGNKRFSDAKLRKKLSSKVGEPLDERKLFTDSQEIQKMYQKSGYPRTEVKPVSNVIEESGRATATFEIKESPKIKIIKVEFVNAKAFSQRKLRKEIKTRKHWMFSWITGSGFLKDEQFEDDQEKLREFYRDHGYIDFELKDVQFVNPTPRQMIIRFNVYEGSRYKVGSVKFAGNKLFSLSELTNGVRFIESIKPGKHKFGPNGLPMDVGDTFTPKGLTSDIEAVEDFYGAKGYIDVTASSRNLIVRRIPNTETGTMDLEFQIDEGQRAYIEKIEIRGNTKTKDKVIRRELAVSPGEVFDMVRVKVSKQRLQGLQYFEKVDARPEPTEPPIAGHKNLVVGVDEKSTGNLTMGAGFSSVDSIVGFAEVYQGNFDLFHPPTFTGGGQKFRLRVQIGTLRQDYLASFIEPWFLGRKIALGIDLYHREANYQSLDNLYDETRTGARLSLTRALWSDFLIGSVSYTLEDVGIHFNSSSTRAHIVEVPGQGGNPPTFVVVPGNTPEALLRESGNSLLSKAGASLAYDTRGGGLLPTRGQRTELFGQFVGGPLGGDKEFFTVELKTAWYFRGLFPGHILELVGRGGVAKSLESGDVPFYERFYLGGLNSLRGFRYRSVSPREGDITEPIGGDSYWFGTAEYSIPIIERLRFAFFYDVGNVAAKPYEFNLDNFNDNFGFGIRLNLPIGPLRLDYGIPIRHDRFNSSTGRFQFGVGYTREF
jgi:outer membrane protein insertion porin family